jgi:hypothetical protein
MVVFTVRSMFRSTSRLHSLTAVPSAYTAAGVEKEKMA